MFEFDLNLKLMVYHLIQLGIAFILSLPIALNREMKDKGAGLRTFPLVSIASCAFMLVAVDIYHGDAPEPEVTPAVKSVQSNLGDFNYAA